MAIVGLGSVGCDTLYGVVCRGWGGGGNGHGGDGRVELRWGGIEALNRGGLPTPRRCRDAP